jgi:MerR family transcriptional regulator, thiopeptide resistance regulator
MFTVKQLSSMAGVTVRTLHHYDEIGLLKPTSIGGNGYRYYEEEALYRLQQILFYRELDVPLSDIKRIMGRRDFDVSTALLAHRSALQGEVERLNRLIRTVDKTIKHIRRKEKMNPKGLFEGFSEEEQDKHAEEAAQNWNPKTVKESNQKWKGYSPAEKERILGEGKALYADLAFVKSKDAASKEVQAVVARWHKHLLHFWSPSEEQLLGLAELYNDDLRFRSSYERVAPKLAEFMRDAVKVYAANRQK